MTPTPPYPNDTLRWVAVEVRFPPLDEFAIGVPRDLRTQLLRTFPILEPQNQLSIPLAPEGPPPQPLVVHRFLRRDRLMCRCALRWAARQLFLKRPSTKVGLPSSKSSPGFSTASKEHIRPLAFCGWDFDISMKSGCPIRHAASQTGMVGLMTGCWLPSR